MSAAGADLDTYATLALVYDDWQAAYGNFSATVLERLLPLLDAQAPPVRSFAEAGCGTGALLVALAARRPDWQLAGADLSPAMLDRARAKPGAERIAWHQLPLGESLPGGPFDAAGCFFNTLNHLGSVPELRQAMAALAATLRPGGLLAFDVNNRAGYASWWNGRNVYQGPGWSMESRAVFDEASHRARARIAVRRGSQTAQVDVVERLFSDDEITAALHEVGLQTVRAEPWSPTPDGAPGSTFWTARRVSPSDFRA